jgi:uncharacterized protein (TIGR03663 family)
MADTKICDKCGAKNPTGNNFCEQCGAKLAAPAAPAAKGAAKAAPAGKVRPDAPAKEKTSEVPLIGGMRLDWMWVAYAVLLLFTVFTRFDHLGNKPHHHDESMHAFYSYQYFTEGNYEYNPMMHGPYQFTGNALMYYLFGVSDATSRYNAAFWGLITVILGMLLAPVWGRTKAFLATLLLAFSPSFMYFDRFTREDAYIAGATFLMAVYLFKYLRDRRATDLWLASLGFVIAFCTKESIFITLASFGTYLFIRLLPWFDVFVAAGLTFVGLLSQLVIPKTSESRYMVLFFFLAAAFGYTVYKLVMSWIRFAKAGSGDSDIWDAILSLEIQKVKWDVIAMVAWWFLILVFWKAFNLNRPTLLSVLMGLAYLVILGRFLWLWVRDRAPALTGSISIIGIVFTLLFSSFFTVGSTAGDFMSRIHGFVNSMYQGAYGGLQYWWDQHDVKRGGQPWYYYLTQLPANEAVSFFFGLVAMAWYLAVRRERKLPLFLAYWYVTSLALFSWAGEKMPWLILHPLLPTLLLTAYFVGDIWETRPDRLLFRYLRTGALVIFGVGLSYSLHSAILLNFYHEANPIEPLVYVQSGDDCKEVDRWVHLISYGETGGPDIHMTVEDKCSWPFAWSLREFKYRGHPTAITLEEKNPIVMTGTESDATAYPALTQLGYINRKYKLRVWWVPDWFKKGQPRTDINFRLFMDWLFGNLLPVGSKRPDMVDWNDLVDWILYRKVWSDMGSYNMRLWVRGDLAAKYGFTETTRSDVPADYPKPDEETVRLGAPQTVRLNAPRAGEGKITLPMGRKR